MITAKALETVDKGELGAFLKSRRAGLDPAMFGFPLVRRRTPGLRREEVAKLAGVSVTWYTWLEQGRGGSPSAGVLNSLSTALMLTEAEREHLFLLALGHPPEARYTAPSGIESRLQRILDALTFNPAYIKTPTWDVVAWNRAAAEIIWDFGSFPIEERNILRLLFCRPDLRNFPDWMKVARVAVAMFRRDLSRSGASKDAENLIEGLLRASPEFRDLWSEKTVQDVYPETKCIQHPKAGLLEFEYSSLAVDGRLDLVLLIYSPTNEQDAERIRTLLDSAE